MEISVIAIKCLQVALVITCSRSSYPSGFNVLLLVLHCGRAQQRRLRKPARDKVNLLTFMPSNQGVEKQKLQMEAVLSRS